MDAPAKFWSLIITICEAVVRKKKQSIDHHNDMLRRLSIKDIRLNVYNPLVAKKPLVFAVSEVQRNCEIHVESVEVSRWEVMSDDIYKVDEELNTIIPYILKTYNYRGFGSRSCCETVGMNTYSGVRKNADRIHPSPVIGPSLKSESQYFRQDWDLTYMPLIQKVVNKLTSDATKHCIDNFQVVDRFLLQQEEGTMFDGIRRHCRVSIITCGGKNTLGFSCTQHRDTTDLKYKHDDITNPDTKRIEEMNENGKTDKSDLYNQKVEIHKSLFGFGVPTTCGYKLVTTDQMTLEDMCFLAYFIIGGFNACVPIQDNMYHIFLGYAFAHSTALPIAILNGIVHYHIDGVNLFAWGASGS